MRGHILIGKTIVIMEQSFKNNDLFYNKGVKFEKKKLKELSFSSFIFLSNIMLK